MTSQVDEYWLDVAHHLHISPRAQDTMTRREWLQAVAAINEIRKENQRG